MDLKIQKSKELFLLGVKHFQNDDLLNAEKFFKESLSLTPDRISVVNNLIQIYIKKENEKNLEKILNKIDNNNIKSFEARSGKAYLLFFKKKYDESINLLKNSLKNGPNEKGYYGYSDHAIGIAPALQSYLRGSKLLEKHFTFNNFNQRETEKANLGAFTPDSLRLFKNLTNEFNIIGGV